MSQFFRDRSISGSDVVETLTGNTGGAIPPSAGNINVIGSGSVTVSGDVGTSTLTISVSGSGLTWNSVPGTSSSMTSNNGYVPQNAGLTTLTLPATSAFGDYIAILGFGSGGWTIAQNAGQNIQIGSVSSTVGVGGSVSSQNRYDSLELICTVANTSWSALGAPQSTGLVVI